MLRKTEKTAKNVKEALALAAKELGADVSELDYEVTREVGKGLMKFLVGSEVDIVAWVKSEAEAEKALNERNKKAKSNDESGLAPKEFDMTKKTKADVVKAAASESAAKENAAKVVASKENSENGKNSETVAKAEKRDKSEKGAPRAERKKDPKCDFVIPKESIDDAKMFLGEILKKIGLDAKIDVRLDGNTIKMDVSGDKMGLLIGKRGDTLDAVQYLTSLYVNKNKGHYIKISIDTENYRLKREETLVRLAKGLQRTVVREKKDITLEPMSPNERRIIHSTLQHDKRITTYSVGEEPNRRLVVSYVKKEASVNEESKQD